MDILGPALAIAGALLVIYACRVLVADAKSGPYVTMGGEMYFAQLWGLASLAGIAGLVMLSGASWWFYVPGVVVFYLISFPLRTFLTAVYLGREAPPPPKDGFKEFIRRTEGKSGAASPREETAPNGIPLAVNGTLMRGLELNANLVRAGASFVCEARTAPEYRLYSINDVYPAMLRAGAGGASIALEIWQVPAEGLAAVLRAEPSGLCIGKVALADGSEVLGVLAEPWLCERAAEITRHGGWREYLAARSSEG